MLPIFLFNFFQFELKLPDRLEVVEFQGQHQANQEIIQPLDLEIGFYFGFLLFGLELVVLFVGEGRVEVQEAQQEGRDESVRPSDAVGGHCGEDEIVVSVHIAWIVGGILWVKKELKQSRPER